MKKIEIEDDLYKYILANIESFGETPSQILRRLLSLPSVDNGSDYSEESQAKIVSEQKVEPQNVSALDDKQSDILNYVTEHDPLPDSAVHSVAALFTDQNFKTEPVITNKFKMMLTTMYHEKRAAFIAAANTTKGRTRDYFGQNLSVLLNSDNQEEVALLKASKPHNIPHTPFWVITNANTGRKRIILTQMMATMGYPASLIERIKDEI